MNWWAQNELHVSRETTGGPARRVSDYYSSQDKAKLGHGDTWLDMVENYVHLMSSIPPGDCHRRPRSLINEWWIVQGEDQKQGWNCMLVKCNHRLSATTATRSLMKRFIRQLIERRYEIHIEKIMHLNCICNLRKMPTAIETHCSEHPETQHAEVKSRWSGQDVRAGN